MHNGSAKLGSRCHGAGGGLVVPFALGNVVDLHMVPWILGQCQQHSDLI